MSICFPASESVALSSRDTRSDSTTVLLVEDHPTNRMVLSHQLALLGYSADIAEDGRQALVLWRANDYGLVLTDCDMPQLDGYALTRAIRQLEQGTGRHVPIVAVTANTMPGDAERGLLAGMDEYLTKPLHLSRLAVAMHKWLGGPKSFVLPITSAATRAPARSVGRPGIRHEALAEAIGTNDPATLQGFYEDFLSNALEIVDLLIQARNLRQPARLAELAHRLKSSAATIGADAMSQHCQVLEQASHHADWAAIHASFEPLESSFGLVIQWLADQES